MENDLISRQAALKALRPIMRKSDYFYEILKAIQDIPSAQPERKMGKWIHDGYAFKGSIDWMHCSECGHKDNWDVATRTPFCAWCGAKMEGEQE